MVIQVKALACEPPVVRHLPRSRFSIAEVARHARQSGLAATLSDTTVWRWRHEDAIRPWPHRGWIFPRDPQFAVKAGRVRDLYERIHEGKALRYDEFVRSTDENTSSQARIRQHPSLPTQPGTPMRVEHEYPRGGAWAYLAALDVHRTMVFGRRECQSGVAPFGRGLDQVMRQPPHNKARRVFWMMDNGSFHRGAKYVTRLQGHYPRLVPVHGPVHASWLNLIEITFAIVQRKVLTPKTSRRWRRSRNDGRPSQPTMKRSPGPLSGNALVAILPRCSRRSDRLPILGHNWQLEPRMRVWTYEPEY